jgi:DMSO/TMAO reductase YedYZ molybdopterin-dependent catalytic subunit
MPAAARARRAVYDRELDGPQLFGRRWRSPIRGPWLTSVFASILLIGLPVVAVTGLLSFIAYGPQFAGNAHPSDVGWLHLPYFAWPTKPAWLYRFTQGLHVTVGLALIPVVFAKLWSVMPRLFALPPVRSVASALERLSLFLLVGSILFEIVTGVMNVQYDYSFGFDFYAAHYYGAWVFSAAFVTHVALKFPSLISALRSREFRKELRTNRSRTRPETGTSDLIASYPAAPTMSRRGAIGFAAGAGLTVAALSVGQTAGGIFRPTALLAPRGRTAGGGPTGFPVNRTARTANITAEMTGDNWRLQLIADSTRQMDRSELLAMRLRAAHLPIACVEGWSTTQTWTGVRLADLADLVGARESLHSARISSLERHGAFNRATLTRGQVLNKDSLLALRVNGVDLSPDHGFPARIIVPALPGVHNTKWVSSIEFRLT